MPLYKKGGLSTLLDLSPLLSCGTEPWSTEQQAVQLERFCNSIEPLMDSLAQQKLENVCLPAVGPKCRPGQLLTADGPRVEVLSTELSLATRVMAAWSSHTVWDPGNSTRPVTESEMLEHGLDLSKYSDEADRNWLSEWTLNTGTDHLYGLTRKGGWFLVSLRFETASKPVMTFSHTVLELRVSSPASALQLLKACPMNANEVISNLFLKHLKALQERRKAMFEETSQLVTEMAVGLNLANALNYPRKPT